MLLEVKVLPSAIVSVDPVAGVVNVTLLILVALATPKTGVVRVGEVAKTTTPVPVSSDREFSRAAEAAVVVKLDDPFVNNPLEAVRPGMLILPVLLSPSVNDCIAVVEMVGVP